MALDQIALFLENRRKDCAGTENQKRLEQASLQGAFIRNGDLIWLGPQTQVEAGAYLQGPLHIGARCQIRHAAYLRGHIIAGDDCVFGHATEVVRSIFLDRAKAPHFAYVGDSILGNGVNLGAGTKCANLRFDQQLIKVHFGNEFAHSNRRKLGAILGDGTMTGCNSYLNPGTILKKGSIFPSPNLSFGAANRR